MSKEPFIVAPSRKPWYWANVDRLNRLDEKAAKKVKPEPTPAPKKTAKPSRAKGGTTRRK